jgi:hypothetical protein
MSTIKKLEKMSMLIFFLQVNNRRNRVRGVINCKLKFQNFSYFKNAGITKKHKNQVKKNIKQGA